jgi:predicted nucleic acid-binding protein
MISIITEIELLGFPGITSKDERLITKLLTKFQAFDVDKRISKETIELRRQYTIRIPDAIIAATALSKAAILVTRDEKDFKRIKHLDILNPFKE